MSLHFCKMSDKNFLRTADGEKYSPAFAAFAVYILPVRDNFAGKGKFNL